jgi:hypothetical protein
MYLITVKRAKPANCNLVTFVNIFHFIFKTIEKEQLYGTAFKD